MMFEPRRQVDRGAPDFAQRFRVPSVLVRSGIHTRCAHSVWSGQDTGAQGPISLSSNTRDDQGVRVDSNRTRLAPKRRA